MKRREEMIIGKHNNPAAEKAEQHPCRILLAAAVMVAGPLLLTMPAFAALNCTAQPSCAELGYSKSNETNCESYVSCPFDTSYKACVKYGADCSSYTLSSCPDTAASCSTCGNGTNVKYKVNSCKMGYELSGETCVDPCSHYPLATCPENVTCERCPYTNLVGHISKYKAVGCADGYATKVENCGKTGSQGWMIQLNLIPNSGTTTPSAQVSSLNGSKTPYTSINDGSTPVINADGSVLGPIIDNTNYVNACLKCVERPCAGIKASNCPMCKSGACYKGDDPEPYCICSSSDCPNSCFANCSNCGGPSCSSSGTYGNCTCMRCNRI